MPRTTNINRRTRTQQLRITDIKKDKIYRANNEDLNIRYRNGELVPGWHDLIIVSVNKRTKNCKVKTITSLEKEVNRRLYFKNNKLDDVRDGNIIVIPKIIALTPIFGIKQNNNNQS